jgi:hypothetical protein
MSTVFHNLRGWTTMANPPDGWHGIDNDIGRLLEKANTVERDVKEIKVTLDKVHTRVSSLEFSHAEARGGWKATSMLGVIAGSIGAFIYHLTHLVWPHP